MTRRSRRAAVIIGCWTFIALLFAPQSYFGNLEAEKPLPGWIVIVASAAVPYVWAALTPLVMWLGRRFPFRRGRIGRTLLLHVAASLVVCVLHLTGVTALQLLLPRVEGYVGPMPRELLLASLVATNVMFYFAILAVTVAITYITRDHERELALVQAQLKSLRGRLQPHFLFNTLNAIAELIYSDTRRAEETVMQLSDVLRLTLQHDQEHEITLGEELHLLRKHVAIYQTLLHDRLAVRWSIDDAALSARVPTMILQPLVENAIRHGVGPRESGGTVAVSAERDGAFLCLTVQDDGVGLKKEAARSGIGLANTHERLRHMYGDAFRFDMREPEGGGLRVAMRLPLREARA